MPEMDSLQTTINRLSNWMLTLPSCAVAFSGGVDSAVVAKSAYLALGKHAIAVTGVGPAVSQRDLQDARGIAQQIGIEHVELSTREIEDRRYRANDGRRCYFCKSQLYESLIAWIESREGLSSQRVLLNGTNIDDLGDYRPGLQAAEEFGVRAPLVELGIGKTRVRELAEYWGLPIYNKPASPCLASRIVYGQSVTEDRLRMIERAEEDLRQRGFNDVRVRWYEGAKARVEVPLDQLSRFEDTTLSSEVDSRLRSFGFDSVEIDPAGLRSGNLNQALPVLNGHPNS